MTSEKIMFNLKRKPHLFAKCWSDLRNYMGNISQSLLTEKVLLLSFAYMYLSRMCDCCVNFINFTTLAFFVFFL